MAQVGLVSDSLSRSPVSCHTPWDSMHDVQLSRSSKDCLMCCFSLHCQSAFVHMAVAALRCCDIRAIIYTCVAYSRTEELARLYMAAGALCDRGHLLNLRRKQNITIGGSMRIGKSTSTCAYIPYIPRATCRQALDMTVTSRWYPYASHRQHPHTRPHVYHVYVIVDATRARAACAASFFGLERLCVIGVRYRRL